MEFLDELVLPQSGHHMLLLKYLLVLTVLIFSVYTGGLLGSVFLSLFFKNKGGYAPRLSKEIIDLFTKNLYLPVAFGVVPLLSSAFCYAQLLHLAPVSVSGYILISVSFYIISIYFIYSYKYAFQFEKIFTLAGSADKIEESDSIKNDLINLSGKARLRKNKFGKYGLIFLITSVYLFIGAAQLATDTQRWTSVDSIFGVVFSLNTLTSFLLFVSTVMALASAIILYKYFRPSSSEVNSGDEYLNFVKRTALNFGIISILISVFFIVLNLFTKPLNSLTSLYFGAIVVLFILFLVLGNLYYAMYKETKVEYSSSVIFLFMLVFLFLSIKDQVSFDTATRDQFNMLAANYEEYHAQVLAESGIGIVEVSGADIYNGKCIACHQFDVKLVGPPYKDVLPKYEGKTEDLAKFILNPVKINPEYPAMPNQGLKPNEAKAVAEYILTTYKPK